MLIPLLDAGWGFEDYTWNALCLVPLHVVVDEGLVDAVPELYLRCQRMCKSLSTSCSDEAELGLSRGCLGFFFRSCS